MQYLKSAVVSGLALLALLSSAAAYAEAGTVQEQTGPATVQRGGATSELLQGQPVEAGDIIETSPGGSLQLTMTSGESIALRSDSRLVIDRYKAPVSQSQPGTGISFYSLVRGGFRAITRSLGQRDLDSYRISTPVATMGIRGTTYELILADDGLYIHVIDGATTVINEAGALHVGAGEYAFVAGPGIAPRLLDSKPAVFNEAGAAAGGSASGFGAGAITFNASLGLAAFGLAAVVIASGDQTTTTTTTTSPAKP